MNQEIKNLIKPRQRILFIFDFDGTTLEAKYGKDTILGCSNNDIAILERDLKMCVYNNMKPLSVIQNVVKQIYEYNKSVKVLSRIHNGIDVLNKMKYLYQQTLIIFNIFIFHLFF